MKKITLFLTLLLGMFGIQEANAMCYNKTKSTSSHGKNMITSMTLKEPHFGVYENHTCKQMLDSIDKAIQQSKLSVAMELYPLALDKAKKESIDDQVIQVHMMFGEFLSKIDDISGAIKEYEEAEDLELDEQKRQLIRGKYLEPLLRRNIRSNVPSHQPPPKSLLLDIFKNLRMPIEKKERDFRYNLPKLVLAESQSEMIDSDFWANNKDKIRLIDLVYDDNNHNQNKSSDGYRSFFKNKELDWSQYLSPVSSLLSLKDKTIWINGIIGFIHVNSDQKINNSELEFIIGKKSKYVFVGNNYIGELNLFDYEHIDQGVYVSSGGTKKLPWIGVRFKRIMVNPIAYICKYYKKCTTTYSHIFQGFDEQTGEWDQLDARVWSPSVRPNFVEVTNKYYSIFRVLSTCASHDNILTTSHFIISSLEVYGNVRGGLPTIEEGKVLQMEFDPFRDDFGDGD